MLRKTLRFASWYISARDSRLWVFIHHDYSNQSIGTSWPYGEDSNNANPKKKHKKGEYCYNIAIKRELFPHNK